MVPDLAFWFGLSGGNTRTASPLYVGNQSLLGVVYRLIGETTALTLLGLAISGLVALLGAVVASQWWRAGEKVFAVALVGLCTCLASPLSWTHHHVWVCRWAWRWCSVATCRAGCGCSPAPGWSG